MDNMDSQQRLRCTFRVIAFSQECAKLDGYVVVGAHARAPPVTNSLTMDHSEFYVLHVAFSTFQSASFKNATLLIPAYFRLTVLGNSQSVAIDCFAERNTLTVFLVFCAHDTVCFSHRHVLPMERQRHRAAVRVHY